jgi:multicomponent Na+:H+ antiporter subunit F
MTLLLLAILPALLVALVGFFRLLVGPSRTDRVIGLDLLFAVAVVLCLVAAWASASTVYLDVAIGLALTGFVATLAWARLIERGNDDGEAAP